jgi:hypothetical protein
MQPGIDVAVHEKKRQLGPSGGLHLPATALVSKYRLFFGRRFDRAKLLCVVKAGFVHIIKKNRG